MLQGSDSDLRAILSVADQLIGRAGRTTLVMALRGSRSKRVLQFESDKAEGYGYFAGVPEEEVMARVDALIARRILGLEYVDGFPLLVYPREGLELAERYAAERWLELVRTQAAAVRQGAVFDLPFVHAKMPNRNLETIGQLIDLLEREADLGWLPFLQAWHAVETKRIRGRLQPIIARLTPAPGSNPPG